jgi:asparagine synthase (glutamine-hydrolysing)
MCGIVGTWNFDGRGVDLAALRRATTAIRHRGPDDEGYLLIDTRSGRTELCGGKDTTAELRLPELSRFASNHFDLAFGFRRLSILELSPAGHQPMASADKREWIIFNGEIYNYLELRDDLISHGHRFHTGSDTEVILAAYRQWGEACVERFNGMFALAIWNTVEKSLFMARDRFGEKPLYYVYVPGKAIAFASEMKALWAGGFAERKIYEPVAAAYKYFKEIETGEQTFFENIYRLPQAHTMMISAAGEVRRRRYWDIDPRIQEEGKNDEWCKEQFRELLTDSVRLRLRADVPVGSSLSGGIDSSTIVSIISRLLPQTAIQKTFSARFDDSFYDEGQWMDMVTAVNKVERHDVWLTADDFFTDLKTLMWHQEEPFNSTSIYAQFAVMRLARTGDVTVLLDGQGADEMLGGYHSYFGERGDDLVRSLDFQSYMRWRRECIEMHGGAPNSVKRVLVQSVPKPVKNTVRRFHQKAKGLPDVKRSDPVYSSEFKNISSFRRALWWNTTREGLVELLRYADRNSMAHSREVRLPFLDHRLVEFVFRLPERLLMRGAWTKWILRESFRGIVPDKIVDRVDKLGYMPPQQRWLGDQVWEDIMLDQLYGVDAPEAKAEMSMA